MYAKLNIWRKSKMIFYRIYLITNLVNNYLYVGQTCKTLTERFKNHVNESGDDTTCYLHNSINKYGPENFKIELIEDNIPEELIDEREIFYIDKYDSYYKNGHGYNMTLGGQGVHGYSHTDETKEKLKLSSVEHWNKLREDTDKYNSLIEKKRMNKGFHWNSEAEGHQILSELAKQRTGEKNPFYGKNHSIELKEKLANLKSIPVVMVSVNGDDLMEFPSGKEAASYIINNPDKFSNVSTNKVSIINSRINKVLHKAAKTAYGYKWKYKCID